MKTKISFWTIGMRIGSYLYLPVFVLIGISMVIEQISVISIAVFIGSLLLFFFGFKTIIFDNIYFDTNQKKIIVRMKIRVFSFEIEMNQLEAIEISKESNYGKYGKYGFDIVFKYKYGANSKVFMGDYNHAFFGQTQYNQTLKTINSWDDYIRAMNKK